MANLVNLVIEGFQDLVDCKVNKEIEVIKGYLALLVPQVKQVVLEEWEQQDSLDR